MYDKSLLLFFGFGLFLLISFFGKYENRQLLLNFQVILFEKLNREMWVFLIQGFYVGKFFIKLIFVIMFLEDI